MSDRLEYPDGGGVLRESASSLGRGPVECVHNFVQLRAPCSAIGPSVFAVTDGKDKEEDDDDHQ